MKSRVRFDMLLKNSIVRVKLNGFNKIKATINSRFVLLLLITIIAINFFGMTSPTGRGQYSPSNNTPGPNEVKLTHVRFLK